jgi:hypothetical protein
MNSFERFKRFSTGAGLLVLAVGFSSLGFLSLINRHPEDAATGFFSEATYSIIGSSISILVGATFLVAAILFAGTLLRERGRSHLYGAKTGAKTQQLFVGDRLQLSEQLPRRAPSERLNRLRATHDTARAVRR